MLNRSITNPQSLVTSHEATRNGFLRIAFDKNRIGTPYIDNARAFRAFTSNVTSANDLLNIREVNAFLVAASGISDKASAYFTEDDKIAAIRDLIENFLIPAGNQFIDEAIYRYLLSRGDTLGGQMRNRIGSLAQEIFIRSIFSYMSLQGLSVDGFYTDNSSWHHIDLAQFGVEENIKGLHWNNCHGDRVMLFNTKIPLVNKNVDICLYSDGIDDFSILRIVTSDANALMFGELKGGIDPAGADEHWKTGNTALERIRTAFFSAGYSDVKTSFIAAAIQNAMAEEIFNQLSDDTLTFAANLTNDEQLMEYCNWLLNM